MCHIWADEMRTVVKDEGVLIFFVLVPLFYPLLYSWIYTNEVVREVPVAVVDMSHSAMSREFIRQFDASPDVRVVKYCTDLDEAKDAVGRQEAFGVVYFPIDFQTRVLRMEQSRVSGFCDMSFMLYYKAIFQTATAVAGNLNSDILIERSGNWTEREDEITAKPLDFDEVQIFNATGGYGNFIIPGVLMLIIQQTLLLGVGLSVGTARERSKTGSFLPDDPIMTECSALCLAVPWRISWCMQWLRLTSRLLCPGCSVSHRFCVPAIRSGSCCHTFCRVCSLR